MKPNSTGHFTTTQWVELSKFRPDLLILLCYYTPIDSTHKVYFRPEAKTGTHKLPRCWNIQHTKYILGARVGENILFGHALLGCDTTLRVFGIGKGVALK